MNWEDKQLDDYYNEIELYDLNDKQIRASKARNELEYDEIMREDND